MAIKINLQSTKIPVEIGDLKFEINMNDEGYEKFITKFRVFVDDMASLAEEKIEDFANIRIQQEKLLDEILGVGAFSAIYEKVSCTTTMTGIIAQIATEIENTILARLDGEEVNTTEKHQLNNS